MTQKSVNLVPGSNVCFAVMSSFAMVVFIQSPTQEAALRSREMLMSWRQIVRDQSKVSPMLLLTLARIDGYFAAGLSDVANFAEARVGVPL